MRGITLCLFFGFLYVVWGLSSKSESDLIGVDSGFVYGENALVYIYVTSRSDIAYDNGTDYSNYTIDATDVFLKGIYFPTVDSISLFDVELSYDSYSGRTDLYVFLQLGTHSKTTPKHYSNNGYIVGSWSAYARMTNGELSGVEWLDGCKECDSESDSCIDDVCALSRDSCSSDSPCNMKVYFAWVGTDSNGRVFTRLVVL
eukprot:TRINITY_DN6785_c0_g1_i2.p1 TRINITY_DN6785_c0_g1~~TRINITY_DN6785_c0_g1_i2.p1  ORF type:complete len:201 (-),score=24.92 TRINITY_DN6785_c0_g1_i2:121-723(-)